MLLPFLLGILGVEFCCSFPNEVLLGVGSLSAITCLLAHYLKHNNKRWFGLSLFILFFILGAGRTQRNDELRKTTHFQEHLRMTQQDTFVAWISNMPELDKWVEVRLTVESINGFSGQTGSLLAYIQRDSSSEHLQYGDRLIFVVRADSIEHSNNPESFNYRRYLAKQNIHYKGYVYQNQWQQLEGQGGWSLLRSIYTLRVHLLEVLFQHLKTESTQGVGAALTLGYRAALSDEVRNAYAATGAIHVLAVSGLHVGLVYFLLRWLLSFLPRDRWYWSVFRAELAILAIWMFALLTGGSPSVLRAATMFSFFAVGDQLKRFNNIYNILATAAFVTLLYDPFLLFNIGFQLSYTAVLGIVYFQPMFAAQLAIKGKILTYFYGLLTVSFAAQLAVAPLSMYYFNQFPVWFWLSSLLVIPAAAVILSLGILLFLFSPFPIFANLIGTILHTIIHWVNQAIFKIQALPLGLIEGIWLSFYEVILIYICILAVAIWMLRRQYLPFVLALLSLTGLCASYAFNSVENTNQRSITVYNVRKASLIDFFDGRTCYTLKTDELTAKSENFAAQQHRWKRGMRAHRTYKLPDSTSIETPNWYYEPPFTQFHNQRLAIISESNFGTMATPIQVDVLLLRDSPNLEIEALEKTFKFDLVIFDSSNYRNKRVAWKEACDVLGIRYHDIAEQGAWVWTQ